MKTLIEIEARGTYSKLSITQGGSLVDQIKAFTSPTLSSDKQKTAETMIYAALGVASDVSTLPFVADRHRLLTAAEAIQILFPYGPHFSPDQNRALASLRAAITAAKMPPESKA
jgi:hypothetical protein